MYFESLHAYHFRNLQSLEMQCSPAHVVLVGPNAQGKTNILEALYLCATGRSFRFAAPHELLQHGAQRGWVKATLVRHGVRHEVEVVIEPKRRMIRVDGRGLRSVGHLLELLNVVAFFPDDLRIAKGSPEERRRFLDRAVANDQPAFFDAAVAYHRVLRTRNALLKSAQGIDVQLLQIYNDQLITYGSQMHLARMHTLDALMPLAQHAFASMMQHGAQLRVGLKSGVRGWDQLGPEAGPEALAAAFRQGLEASVAQDRARHTTTVGPHRADMLLHVNGQEARVFASQGQQRAIVLALKLAEVGHLRGRLGAPPILLLDDVSSELDQERTGFLFKELSALGSQVWLTTTGAVALPLPADAQRYDVVQGAVQRRID